MTIDLEGANAYFDLNNHVDAAAWSAFSAAQQGAAIETAKRQLARALRRSLGSWNDDKATYEQALFLLKTHAMAQGGAALQPYPVAQDAEVAQGAAAFTDNKKPFSDEALRWLGWNGVSIVRG